MLAVDCNHLDDISENCTAGDCCAAGGGPRSARLVTCRCCRMPHSAHAQAVPSSACFINVKQHALWNAVQSREFRSRCAATDAADVGFLAPEFALPHHSHCKVKRLPNCMCYNTPAELHFVLPFNS